jgi:hypothetical protein
MSSQTTLGLAGGRETAALLGVSQKHGGPLAPRQDPGVSLSEACRLAIAALLSGAGVWLVTVAAARPNPSNDWVLVVQVASFLFAVCTGWLVSARRLRERGAAMWLAIPLWLAGVVGGYALIRATNVLAP